MVIYFVLFPQSLGQSMNFNQSVEFFFDYIIFKQFIHKFLLCYFS